jgi:hypothetical protein
MKNILFISVTLFIFTVYIGNSNGQDTTTVRNHHGIRIQSFYDFQVRSDYDFRIFQIAPVYTVGGKNLDWYFGPQYEYIFQPSQDNSDIYKKHSFGFNIGFRYYTNDLIKNFRLFGQFNYLVFILYYYNHYHNPLGSSYTQIDKHIVAENTVLFGADYKVIQPLHFSCGTGFGSFGGFFLFYKKFALTTHLGIEYKFD